MKKDAACSMAFRANRRALTSWYFCFQPCFRERVPF